VCGSGLREVVFTLGIPVRTEATATARRKVGAGRYAARTRERDGAREHGRAGLGGAAAAFAAGQVVGAQ